MNSGSAEITSFVETSVHPLLKTVSEHNIDSGIKGVVNSDELLELLRYHRETGEPFKIDGVIFAQLVRWASDHSDLPFELVSGNGAFLSKHLFAEETTQNNNPRYELIVMQLRNPDDVHLWNRAFFMAYDTKTGTYLSLVGGRSRTVLFRGTRAQWVQIACSKMEEDALDKPKLRHLLQRIQKHKDDDHTWSFGLPM